MKMANFVTNKQGFINLVAMLMVVVVTGGAIVLGTASVDNVNKQGCGEAFDSWSKGNVYAKIGDNDGQALENSVDCQKAIYVSVAAAKPVATMMSASGNLGGDKSNAATVVVDRMMDMTDNLSNPSHKAPVRDSLLPPAIVNFFWGEEEAEKEEDTISFSSQHVISVVGSESRVDSANGVSVSSSYNLDGTLTVDFMSDGSASCSLVATTTIHLSGIAGYNSDGFAELASVTCSGTLDENNEFVLIGVADESYVGQGQSLSDNDGFSVIGYLEDGKISGSIDFVEGTSIWFEE